MRRDSVDDKSPLEMRPKVIWRFACPALAAGALVLLWGDRSWQLWMATVWLAVLAFGAQRSFIRIEDRTIYRRGVVRWHEPFQLDDLTDVSLRREWTLGRNPRIELSLRSQDGASFSFQPRWWTNEGRLLHLVAVAASEEVSGPVPGRSWKLDLDAQTERRLARHLKASH